MGDGRGGRGVPVVLISTALLPYPGVHHKRAKKKKKQEAMKKQEVSGRDHVGTRGGEDRGSRAAAAAAAAAGRTEFGEGKASDVFERVDALEQQLVVPLGAQLQDSPAEEVELLSCRVVSCGGWRRPADKAAVSVNVCVCI